MKKQIVCRIFAVVLAAVLLVGCQSAPGPESGASGASDERDVYIRPIEPDGTLRVLSMYRDYTLETAAKLFEEKNEGITVEYEYYEMGEISTEGSLNDIMQQINLEILNGLGPDVICLDGFPEAGFLKQGAFLDLSEGVDTSDFYPAFAQPLTEGGTFIIPLTVRLPVVIGKDGAVDNADAQIRAITQGASIPVDEMNRLYDWNGMDGAPTPLNERAGLLFSGINPIFEDLWASLSDRFIVDNVLQTDVVRQLLQKMQEYYNVTQFNPDSYDYTYDGGSSLSTGRLTLHIKSSDGFSTLMLRMGIADYALGEISNLDTLALYFAPDKFPEITYIRDFTIVPSRGMGDTSMWHAVNKMAVPASGVNTQLAQQFIQHCLSPEVQAIRTINGFGSDGLSVTRATMDRQINKLADLLETYDREIDREAFKSWVEELLSGYERPVRYFSGLDMDLKWIVYDAAIALYEGKTTLDAAVNGIEAQFQMYLRELM